MRLIATLLLLAALAPAENWLLPRGDLANTGVVKNKGPKRKPKMLWNREESGDIGTGAALSAGRLVYAVGTRHVVCRSERTAAAFWEKEVKQAVRAWPAILGELAYFGGQDHMHYRIKMQNGDEPTSHEAQSSIVAAPAVTKEFYVAGSIGGWLYAMGPQSGTLIWRREVGPVHHAVAIGKGSVFVVNETGKVSAFLLRRGKARWVVETAVAPVAAPIHTKAFLYVPVTDAIVALEPKRGQESHRIEAKGLTGAPVVAKDRLYYGTAAGDVVAFDLKRRKEIARIRVADDGLTAPLILARKTLYGAAGATLFAMDTARLATLWTYEGKEPFAPPMVANGAIYVGAGATFYCLK